MRKISCLLLCLACALCLFGCNKASLVQKKVAFFNQGSSDKNIVMGKTFISTNKENLIDSIFFEGKEYSYVIDIFESQNRGQHVDISVQKGREDLGIITIEKEEWGDILPEASKMITENDVDFDGDIDVLVCLGLFGEYEDRKYKCYLSRSSKLEYCYGFEKISNPQIFCENSMIVGFSKGEEEDVIYEKYEFVNHTFQNTNNLVVQKKDVYDMYDNIYFDIMFNREHENIQSAYEYIIDSYEKSYTSTCNYDLIYFDNNEIPELVVGMNGAFVSMYTFHEKTIYPLIHEWTYGAGGNSGYEYREKMGMIRNNNSDYAGSVMYTTCYELTNLQDISVKYFLKGVFEDKEGNVIKDDSKQEEGEWKYYFSNEEAVDTPITEAEYASYAINGEFIFMKGKYNKEEVLQMLGSYLRYETSQMKGGDK